MPYETDLPPSILNSQAQNWKQVDCHFPITANYLDISQRMALIPIVQTLAGH